MQEVSFFMFSLFRFWNRFRFEFILVGSFSSILAPILLIGKVSQFCKLSPIMNFLFGGGRGQICKVVELGLLCHRARAFCLKISLLGVTGHSLFLRRPHEGQNQVQQDTRRPSWGRRKNKEPPVTPSREIFRQNALARSQRRPSSTTSPPPPRPPPERKCILGNSS